MRRSKLEMYISTLEALAYHGPLKLTGVTYKAKMNWGQLKVILADLIHKQLVEKRSLGKRKTIFFAATPRARRTLSYFNELKELLPLEDYNKRF